MTETAAPVPAGPSFLEKLGGEALDVVVAEATAHETEILAFVDGEIAAGETSVVTALTAGFKAKVPLVGGSVGAAISTAVAGLPVDATVKQGYDAVVAALKAKATALGG